jgi:hypothetical protein
VFTVVKIAIKLTKTKKKQAKGPGPKQMMKLDGLNHGFMGQKRVKL